MMLFEDFMLNKALNSAVNDLGFIRATPIQTESYSLARSGKNVVGIAQTGTGKTLAYALPILQDMKYSDQFPPRVLVLVPTRELVIQVENVFRSLAKYTNTRILGIYGGVNINKQKKAVSEGCDILIATPGRLYDIAMSNVLQLREVKRLVIDEVDVMLDLGFRHQLTSIFEILPDKRQNLMYSATMTTEVDTMIQDYFIKPEKIAIAMSGEPLENIRQMAYPVYNFHTKTNLLASMLSNQEEYSKVIVFVATKKRADKLVEILEDKHEVQTLAVHSNKTQNFRFNALRDFENGISRIIVATDLMARGIDLAKVSHVINFDTPEFPENYIHRIGRTGRAERSGNSILFYTPKEEKYKTAIEELMQLKMEEMSFPEEVDVNYELVDEERNKPSRQSKNRTQDLTVSTGGAFHEKKLKNTKTNQGGSYLRKRKVHKKPQTRRDKK